MRTDRHNNPTAITTDVARQGGLVIGTDYTVGDPFPSNPAMFTARLIGDPIALTIKVIDKLGFYTKAGIGRWTYISLPKFVWASLSGEQKRDVIGYMYGHEGGTVMRPLFPNYGSA